MLVRKILLIILLLFVGGVKAKDFPLEISEIVASNSMVHYNGQKLVLVDFWATWCIPCRAATTQLEILQEQLKKELFVVSITDETQETVHRHIRKHPSKLLIARDIQGNLIRKFKVYNRPYAILFTSNGKVLWRGHPAELTVRKIKSLHRRFFRTPSNPTLRDILSVYEIQDASTQNSEDEISIFVEKITEGGTRLEKESKRVNYYGSVSGLIAQLKRVPKHCIQIASQRDFSVHLQAPTIIWDKNPDVLLRLLHAKFGMQIVEKSVVEEVYVMKVIAPSKLWNAKQIDWGASNVYKYLVGEERVQADNFTIVDFCILLSDVKKKNYQYLGQDNQEYDWNLHFLFDNLMEMELLDEFGIQLKKEKVKLRYFSVQ